MAKDWQNGLLVSCKKINFKNSMISLKLQKSYRAVPGKTRSHQRRKKRAQKMMKKPMIPQVATYLSMLVPLPSRVTSRVAVLLMSSSDRGRV